MSNPKWNIDRYVKKQESKAESALKITSFWLAGKAKDLTPRITNRLAGSISSSVGSESPQNLTESVGAKDGVPSSNNNLKGWIGTSVEYAPHVEFGTHRTHKGGSTKSSSKGQHAQGMLRLALYSNKAQIQKFFSRNMK